MLHLSHTWNFGLYYSFCLCFAASIPYICQPVGSVMSGILVQVFGRKRSLILVNVPFLAGWLLVCTANTFEQLVAAQVILGVTIGLCEAPLNTYYGEISQPELRGILAGTAGKDGGTYRGNSW